MISDLKTPQKLHHESQLGDTTVNLDSFPDPSNENDPLNYLNKIKTTLDCTPEKEGSECLASKKKFSHKKEALFVLFSKLKTVFQHPQKRKKFATIGLLLVLIGISNVWTPSFPSPNKMISSISRKPLNHPKNPPSGEALRVSQEVPKKLPEITVSQEPVPTVANEPSKEILAPEMTEYLVQRGDSLYKIAQDQLGSTSYAKELAKYNGLESPYRIKVGQVLKVPKKLSIKEEKENVSVPTKISEPPLNAVTEQDYEVLVGDSLYKIAEKKLGNGIYARQLAEYNKLKDPSKIRVGQVLKIPLTLAKADLKENK